MPKTKIKKTSGTPTGVPAMRAAPKPPRGLWRDGSASAGLYAAINNWIHEYNFPEFSTEEFLRDFVLETVMVLAYCMRLQKRLATKVGLTITDESILRIADEALRGRYDRERFEAAEPDPALR
jgi:hypothetical protein